MSRHVTNADLLRKSECFVQKTHQMQVLESFAQVFTQMRKIFRANTQIFEPNAQVGLQNLAKIRKN